MKSIDEARRLMQEASQLDHCDTQVSLLEEAARIAEEAGGLDVTFAARNEIIDAAVFSGRSDLAIVAFTWCRNQVDRDPERFSMDELLWKYKWIIGALNSFPQVSLTQLDQFLREMEDRYRAEGLSMYSIWLSRLRNAADTYQLNECPPLLASLRQAKRDHFSDCIACVAGYMIEYAALVGDWQGAVDQFDEMIATKRTCLEEPHLAYARVLFPLVKLNRWDRARECYKRGYAMVRRNVDMVAPHARHIAFAVLNRDLPAAKRMLARHTEAAWRNPSYCHRLEYLYAMLLFALYLEREGVGAVSLRLPESLTPARAKGKIAVDELVAWCRAEARSIADQFDARNGNAYCRTRLDRLPELLDLTENAT